MSVREYEELLSNKNSKHIVEQDLLSFELQKGKIEDLIKRAKEELTKLKEASK